jgi:hypothetical protein
MARPNSTKLSTICITIRPVGVVMSMFSVTGRLPAPTSAIRSLMLQHVLQGVRQPAALPDYRGVSLHACWFRMSGCSGGSASCTSASVERTFQVLADGLCVTDPALSPFRFAWLGDAPEAPAPTTMLVLLDRLDWMSAVGVGPAGAKRIYAARRARPVEGFLAGVGPLAGPPCRLRRLPFLKHR